MENMDKNNCLGDVPLSVIKPDWNSHSNLVNTIIELEQLRVRVLGGTTPPHIFFQLKEVFHKLESLGSSRIEGNRTTLAELIEKITDEDFERSVGQDEKLQEIVNIEKAIQFVEEVVAEGTKITRIHLSDIHKIITHNLTPPQRVRGGEGSMTPGEFRTNKVEILNSQLCPPDHTQVPSYMEELLDFVNHDVDNKDRLLRVAIAHHRFTWIHPFDNGNGRLVRAFTYALLIAYGFRVKDGHILNPAAIFCMDREKYYDMLELADSGKEDDILAWCEYVLEGLVEEIRKIDKLSDYIYLRDTILLPALADVFEHKLITEDEYSILLYSIRNSNFSLKAKDVQGVLEGTYSPASISIKIRQMREKGLLRSGKKGGRIYSVSFMNKYLLRGVITALEKNGFAPGLSGDND